MDIKLWLIGTCRLTIDGEPVDLTGNKLLALLAYLATERGFHAREVLMTLFWGNYAQDRAMNNLRQFLHKLRVLLPEGILETNRLTAGIPADVLFWTDVGVVQAAYNTQADTLPELEAAAALINGQFMQGVNLPDAPEFDDWQFQKRHDIHTQSLNILQRVITRARNAGEYAKAIRYAEQLSALEPLDEHHHRLLMQLYMQHDQPHAAINQYHILQEILDREMGEQPDAETQRLYQSILEIEMPPTPEETTEIAVISIYPPRPSLTVGRVDDLANLLERLQTYPLVAIQGWPGVGKSTIAALLAYSPETARLMPDGVLWTAVERTTSTAPLLRRWAQALGLVDNNATPETVKIRLRHYLKDKRVLLIVDDVWDADVIHDFLIGGEGCRLILTTRENDIARAVTQSPREIYRLNILADEDALALLQQIAPDVVNAHPAEMQMLISDLEGLPLALQVAGRLLQFEYEMGWGIKELLAALREGTGLLEAQAPHDRRIEEDDVPTTVTTLLRQSTNRLDAANRLRFAALGVFAPKPATFSERALAAIWQMDDPRETIRLFVGRGLMETTDDGRFAVHALLIAHARSLFAV